MSDTIDAIFAWIAEEKDGGEGIIGSRLPGRVTALIGTDLEHVRTYRPLAKALAKTTGRRIMLRRFTAGAILDEIYL